MESEVQKLQDKKSQTPLGKVLLIFAVVIIIILGGLALSNLNNKNVSPPKGQEMSMEGAPEENTFYLARKDNSPVLFYRYPDMLVENDKPSPFVGHFAAYETPYNLKKNPNEYVDFQTLQNPSKLFSFEGHAGIENYILSTDKKYLFLSFLGGKNDDINYIYQINLEDLNSKKLWEHKLRSGKAPYNAGIAHVIQAIPDQYIILAINKGQPLSWVAPEGVVVKNIKSGQEKLLGVVGDIQIDSAAGKISFRKLEKTKTPCVKNDPVCFATDTYKYIYQPAGQLFTQPLP